MNAFVCLLLNWVDLCRISLYWKSDTFQLAMTSGEPWLCIKKSCIHWFLLVVFSFAKSCIHFISSHVHCLHYMTVNVLTRIFLLKNTLLSLYHDVCQSISYNNLSATKASYLYESYFTSILYLVLLCWYVMFFIVC